MAGKFSRKKQEPGASWVLGAVLIALLLAVITLGALWVLRASKRVGTSGEAASQTSTEPSNAQETAMQQQAPEAVPEPQSEPEALPAEPEPEPEPESARVTLMALGDNLIHNTVYWSAELPDGGYDFTPFYAAIAPVVSQYDIACINQETILVDDPALYANYPNFGSPTQVADALAKTGFSVVTGATNHCFDKGETGILDTCRYWREHYPDITTLGIHDSEEDANRLRVIEKNGIRIALLNYTYGLNGGAPGKAWMVDRFVTFDAVKADLARVKEASDFVIVFAHWGEEDTFRPNDYEKTWAQVLADGGADLIIGGHTHTLQPVELLTASDGRDVPVYYSLENFLSHQKEKMNLLGGMASVTIVKDADGTHVSEYDLKPTINVILRNENTGWYTYRPMLLDSYGTELAAQNRFSECTIDAMWALYEDITG